MMQYSLYYKTINTITKYTYEKKHLVSIAPEKGHIRSFIITERQFYDMQIISGNKSLNERINNCERYIKINEDIWK